MKALKIVAVVVPVYVGIVVATFFDKLIARGKKPLQAYVAVMRKLLHAIYGMLRTGTDFIPEKFHAAA